MQTVFDIIKQTVTNQHSDQIVYGDIGKEIPISYTLSNQYNMNNNNSDYNYYSDMGESEQDIYNNMMAADLNRLRRFSK